MPQQSLTSLAVLAWRGHDRYGDVIVSRVSGTP